MKGEGKDTRGHDDNCMHSAGERRGEDTEREVIGTEGEERRGGSDTIGGREITCSIRANKM